MVAAALLAVLTGASNLTPGGGGRPGRQVAVSSRGPAGVLAPPAATTDAVTTTPVAPDVAAAAVGAAEGAEGREGIPASEASGDHGPAEATTSGDAAVTGDAESAPAEDAPDPDPDPARTRPAPAAEAGTVTAVPVAAPTPPVAALTRLPDVELEVLDLTNIDRRDNGVPAVDRDGCMDAEASAWAGAMAESGTMAHSGGAGGAVQGCRGPGAYWGDNIGYWQPCRASAMETWWMGSASHRPHILDATFTVVGIGVWSEPSGRCWFEVYFGS